MEEILYDHPINDSIKPLDEIKKYQQKKVMIIKLVVYWNFLILKKKKKRRLIAGDSNKKGLDVDSRIIQQIIFTGKIKATVAITRVIISYILDQSKETFF